MNVGEDDYLEPRDALHVEQKIKRSLFIAHLAPTRGGEEVRSFLACVEAEHRSATHNCWGYRLGPDPEIEYASDDGEPAGTAGKPILSAIRQSGMVNLTIVVTRYFGGIKLGVRGLIEAYGGMASLAVSRADRITQIRSRRLVIRLPYAIIGDVTHLLNGHGLVGTPEWAYGAEVEVVADIRVSAEPHLQSVLDELQARKAISFWKWVRLD